MKSIALLSYSVLAVLISTGCRNRSLSSASATIDVHDIALEDVIAYIRRPDFTDMVAEQSTVGHDLKEVTVERTARPIPSPEELDAAHGLIQQEIESLRAKIESLKDNVRELPEEGPTRIRVLGSIGRHQILAKKLEERAQGLGRPGRDILLISVTASSEGSALSLVSTVIAQLKHHFDALLEKKQIQEIEENNGLTNEEKRLARASPLAAKSARSAGSTSTRCSASLNAATSLSGTVKPASPTTSGNEETFDTITGTPQAIASKGGNPNPS